MRYALTLFFNFLLIAGLPGLALMLAPPPVVTARTAPPMAISPAGTTPTQTVTLQSTPGSNYRYTGTQLASLPLQVSFAYQNLAADVTGEIQLARPYSGGPTGPAPDTAYPTHLRFFFVDAPPVEALVGVGGRPQLRIYPVNDYRLIYGADQSQQATLLINETINRLQASLVNRPQSFTGDLPFLPPQHNAQIFQAQIKYLDFQGGAGIRFITQHSLGGPITNRSIFYTFQGLTADGQYYVALFYPVSTTVLAGADENQSFETVADFQAHVQATTQQLDRLSPNQFTPDLSLLDGLIESLQVTAPTLSTTGPGEKNLIVFATGNGIYTVEANTGQLTLLAQVDEQLCCPRWSPDHQKIAFAIGNGMHYGIYVMNADGSDLERLTYIPRTDGDRPPLSPVWSDDGQHLEFVYGAYGYAGLQEVTSPDGQRVAYSRRAETEQFMHELLVKNVDGTHITRLITSTETIFGIDW